MTSDSLGLAARIASHWRAKMSLTALLTALFCVGYFSLQHIEIAPPTRCPLTFLDERVAFQPCWVWVYQSPYLLMPFAWLIPTRAQLRSYARGFALILLVGFSCFLIWPVAGPRPNTTPKDGMYGLLISYDETTNCFPSLHLALATYTVCVVLTVTVGRWKRAFACALAAWVALIGYSTLATKQHYFIDLPPGILLGWVGWRISWSAQREGATGPHTLATQGRRQAFVP